MIYRLLLWVGAMLIVLAGSVVILSFAALEFQHPLDNPIGRGVFAFFGCVMAIKITNKDFDIGEG